MRKSSGDICSQVANELPNSLQLPAQDDHPDDAPSSPVCRIPDAILPGLASSSQSQVYNTTHAEGKQVLAEGDLSREHGRVDNDLQLNDSNHFVASSSGSMIASGLPPSVRSIRPWPVKVMTMRILPRRGQHLITVTKSPKQTLGHEAVDGLLKDDSNNASSMHSQTVSVPMTDWTQDNDQDDDVDVDEIANEFGAPSANDAPRPLPSCKEVVEPTIQPCRPPLPAAVMPPIWAQVRTTL